MISIRDIPTLYEYMSNIFSYGLLKQYSLEAIQDRISFSEMFWRLENSDSSFLAKRTMHEEIELIYSREIDVELFNNKTSIAYWLGEAYIRLFFKFHKSIFYIFLYLPLDTMINLYPVYHEMDWIKLFEYFEANVKKNNLLPMLLKKRNLSINKLSTLTGISANTIQYYCLNDNHLFEAKYLYIDLLSQALKVKNNLFLKEIHNYTNSSGYDFDKTNPTYRSYLALNYTSYYSLEIKKRKYKLDAVNNIFISGNKYLKVLWTRSESFVDFIDTMNREIVTLVDNYSKSIDPEKRKNTVLVIFEFNKISRFVKPYVPLLKYGFEKIFIINQESILCVCENYWISYLTDSINSSMIEQAKKKTGSDFAI